MAKHLRESFGQVPDRLVAELGARAAALWAFVRGREARGERAEVALADLARHLGCGRRHIQVLAARLEATGWLRRRRTARETLYATLVPPGQDNTSTSDDAHPRAHQMRTPVRLRRARACASGRPPPTTPPGGSTERRGEENGPPPLAHPPGTAETASASTPAGILPEIAAFLARQAPPDSAAVVLAEISRDLALGRYTVQDLREYVDALPRIAARSWQVRDELPRVLATRRALDRRRRLEAVRAWVGRPGWLADDPVTLGCILAVDVERGRVTVRWDATRTVEFRDPVARVFRPPQPVPARTETRDAGQFLAAWRLEDDALPLWGQGRRGPEAGESAGT